MNQFWALAPVRQQLQGSSIFNLNNALLARCRLTETSTVYVVVLTGLLHRREKSHISHSATARHPYCSSAAVVQTSAIV